jgi:long-chain acyl-CoA synthetase
LKLYPPELSAEMDLPEVSIPQTLDEIGKKWKERTAIIFYGAKISYKKLTEYVDRFATALQDLGVKKGEIVALHMLNCPQYVIALLASAKVGAIVTPISPVYVVPEIKHQLEDSQAQTIIGADILFDLVEQTNVEFKNIILTSIDEYLPRFKKFMGKSILRGVYRKMSIPPAQVFKRKGTYRFQDLLKRYPPEPKTIEINPSEDLIALPYTGGTTALPKAAMITHYNIVSEQILVDTFQAARFGPSDKRIQEEGKEVFAAYAPFYHIMGLCGIFQSLITGSTTVIFTTPDIDDIFRSIVNYGITQFGGAPAIFDMLKDYEKTDRIDWKRMCMIRAGADSLHEETAKGWEERTGTLLDEAYGLSESCASICMGPIGRYKTGSLGLPIPNTSIAIMDPDSTDFMPVGEVGEIIIKGPTVFRGYWRRPEETEQSLIEIDGEQWLRSGDLGSMDDEGYFYFYDRKRDMIKYKGYAVFARQVEEVIKAHPQVKDTGVIGISDPKVGEHVKAVVILEREARGRLSEEEIIKYCEEKLAHYKVPRIIEFRGEIPKTDVGKVSRRELREELE